MAVSVLLLKKKVQPCTFNLNHWWWTKNNQRFWWVMSDRVNWLQYKSMSFWTQDLQQKWFCIKGFFQIWWVLEESGVCGRLSLYIAPTIVTAPPIVHTLCLPVPHRDSHKLTNLSSPWLHQTTMRHEPPLTDFLMKLAIELDLYVIGCFQIGLSRIRVAISKYDHITYRWLFQI